MMAMKKPKWIMMVKNSPQGKKRWHDSTMAHVRILSPIKKSSYKETDRQGPSMGILPGVANNQATVLEPSDPVPFEDAVATG